LPADLERVELGRIVREVADRSPAPPSITVHTEVVATALVRGDAGELARVVDNLLRNALAHARQEVRLNVDVDVDAGRVVVRVTNDGPGVPARHADRVFERFFRGDAARSRGSGATRGHGLGLSIARTLARRHGGDVELVHARGGATFVLILPQAPSAA